ncbi:hypothetical protein KO504_05000 [Winogradskyella psychrotolerans]|uniref:hypothetical protein n=1 Tax=Winogradskyella psychrotolerans TaxID=1344585 RepID=UPI001C06E331|nr:hypothetical protein [Winogradskyella psychrotolerans]MBU2920687.1 hypothetical protein [Winogradskyella psychrotolerans]
MENVFKVFEKLFTERCNHIPLLDMGEDSVRYDFFTALTLDKGLKNYEIILESGIDSRCYIPRANIRAYRKEKPKMDLVVDKLNICAEFGLFRQNSNEEGTINKTNRLIKTLNDMIRLGLETYFTKRKAYFICVADAKMLGHQLQSKLLERFPADYRITPNLVTELCEMKTSNFDFRFVDKMNELNLSFNANILHNEPILADKINMETRLIIWEVIC